MFSTQKFFNLDLRSLGFIIAITSIFYHVYSFFKSLAELAKTDDEDDDYIRIKDFYDIIFIMKKNKTEQVITEGGDVLSEDDFLNILESLNDGMSGVGLTVSVIVCPLLLVALIKKKPVLIWPWLIYWAASLIFNWVICVTVILHMMLVDTFVSAEQMNYTVHKSMAMGLFFALWVAMLSLHEEEKKENIS